MAMTKSGVEYCDYSFNAVTGCLHDCPYCYARGIVRRFDLGIYGGTANRNMLEPMKTAKREDAREEDYRIAAYPYGFAPTMRRYKLDEPSKVKKPSTIFVSDMGDLFGEWVPDEWIEAVFNACKAAPQHRYLFLTKNPMRYIDMYEDGILPANKNFWFGSTVTNVASAIPFRSVSLNRFVSVEPLLENIHHNITGFMDWVIIGRDTSPCADRSIPKREWIENIVAACKAANVPVFMKSNLAETKRKGEVALFDKSELIQQYPWERGTV